MDKQVFLTAAIELRASADGKIPAEFSGVAYGGDFVSKYGGIVVDLASLRTDPGSLPLLFDHESDSYVGVVDKIDNTGAALSAAGKLFSDIDEQAKLIALKSQRGARYQMSLGLFEYSEEYVPAGVSFQANGRNFTGPVYVLRNALLGEISIVPTGAARSTTASFFSQKGTEMDPNQTRIAELTAQADKDKAEIASLTAKLTASEAECTTLKAKAESDAKAARLGAVRALFGDIGKTYADDTAAPYVAMSAEGFDAVAAELRAAAKKPAVPARLFSGTPAGDTGANQGAGGSILVTRAKAAFGLK